jgi:hypothetical protein
MCSRPLTQGHVGLGIEGRLDISQSRYLHVSE